MDGNSYNQQPSSDSTMDEIVMEVGRILPTIRMASNIGRCINIHLKEFVKSISSKLPENIDTAISPGASDSQPLIQMDRIEAEESDSIPALKLAPALGDGSENSFVASAELTVQVQARQEETNDAKDFGGPADSLPVGTLDGHEKNSSDSSSKEVGVENKVTLAIEFFLILYRTRQ
jgi:hypothetical protein